MTTTTTKISKLGRLNLLYDALAECKRESVSDSDEWNAYNDMMERVKDMLTDERRKQGWMAVYPIVDGCAQEALFEGTKEQCGIYVDILKESDPKADIIVLQL